MTAELAVTVTAGARLQLRQRAQHLATTWGLPYLERERKSGLLDAFGDAAQAFLILGHDGWTLREGDATLRYSPGMAALRIKRLAAGDPNDALIGMLELRAGDRLFDGTLGLGADALVCAHVVGPSGRVMASESSLPLFLLVSEGLAAKRDPRACAIETKYGACLDVLRAQPAGAFDCVMLDPMFDRPKKSSPAFEVLRRFADTTALTREVIDEAARVARRWVVVKGGRNTQDFARLGLSRVPTSRYNPTIWARVAGRGA